MNNKLTANEWIRSNPTIPIIKPIYYVHWMYAWDVPGVINWYVMEERKDGLDYVDVEVAGPFASMSYAKLVARRMEQGEQQVTLDAGDL